MTIGEKLKIIDEIVPKEDASIEHLGGQSIKITHKCGCTLVEHFLDNQSAIQTMTMEKRFFVELCREHKNYDNHRPNQNNSNATE